MSLALQRRRAREAKAELRSISAHTARPDHHASASSPSVTPALPTRSELLLRKSRQLTVPTKQVRETPQPKRYDATPVRKPVQQDRPSQDRAGREERLVERGDSGVSRRTSPQRTNTNRIVSSFKESSAESRSPQHMLPVSKAAALACDSSPKSKAALLGRASSPTPTIANDSPRSTRSRSSPRSSPGTSPPASSMLSEIGQAMNSPPGSDAKESYRRALSSRSPAIPVPRLGSRTPRTSSPSRRTSSPSRRTSSPSRRTSSPNRRTSSPNRRTSSPSRHADSPSRHADSPSTSCSPIERYLSCTRVPAAQSPSASSSPARGDSELPWASDGETPFWDRSPYGHRSPSSATDRQSSASGPQLPSPTSSGRLGSTEEHVEVVGLGQMVVDNEEVQRLAKELQRDASKQTNDKIFALQQEILSSPRKSPRRKALKAKIAALEDRQAQDRHVRSQPPTPQDSSKAIAVLGSLRFAKRFGILRWQRRVGELRVISNKMALATRQVQLMQSVHALCWWTQYHLLQRQRAAAKARERKEPTAKEVRGAERANEIELLHQELVLVRREYREVARELETINKAADHRLVQQRKKQDIVVADSRAACEDLTELLETTDRRARRASQALDAMEGERDDACRQVEDLKRQVIRLAELSNDARARRDLVECEAWQNECAELQFRNRKMELRVASLESALAQGEDKERQMREANSLMEREREMLMTKLVAAEHRLEQGDDSEVASLQRDVFTTLVVLEERDREMAELQYKLEQSEALNTMTEIRSQQDRMIGEIELQRDPVPSASGRSPPAFGGSRGRSPPSSRAPSSPSIGRARSPTALENSLACVGEDKV